MALSADRLIELYERLRAAECGSRVEDRPDQLAQHVWGGLVVIAGEHADDRRGLAGHFTIERQVSFHPHHDEWKRIGLLHGIDGIVHGSEEGPERFVTHRRAVDALASGELRRSAGSSMDHGEWPGCVLVQDGCPGVV